VAEEVAGFFVLLRSSGMGDKTDLGDDVSTDCFSIAPLPRDGVKREDILPFCTELRAAARQRLAATDEDTSGGWRGGGGGGGFFIFFIIEIICWKRT